MIFILAKNVETAQRLARLNDLLPKDYYVLTSPERVRSLQMQSVLWLCDSHVDNPYANQILEIALARNFKIFRLSLVTKLEVKTWLQGTTCY